MKEKYPEDFRAKEWNWSDYINNNSNGLLSQIVENTRSDKDNSEIYKQTKNSIKNFEEYLNYSKPKIGKIVTSKDFQRLFRGDISEQVLADSFGLVTSDGKPLDDSIELLIAKRLAKMQKGIASADTTTLRKNQSFTRTQMAGQGVNRYAPRRSISHAGHHENFIAPEDRGTPISPTYDVIDPETDPEDEMRVVHPRIKKQSLILQLIGRISANLMPFGVGHAVEAVTTAASNSLTQSARNAGANPETAQKMLGRRSSGPTLDDPEEENDSKREAPVFPI